MDDIQNQHADSAEQFSDLKGAAKSAKAAEVTPAPDGGRPRLIPLPSAGRPAPKRSRRKKDGIWKSIKAWSWRATAFCIWVKWILLTVGGRQLTDTVGRELDSRLGQYLTPVGFVPVNSEQLGLVLRYGWVLAITAFKPLELLGLFFYVIFSPVSLLFYLWFRGAFADTDSPSGSQPGLRPPARRRPGIPVVSVLFLGWLLLFGNASGFRPVLLGALLSGALFVMFLVRAFQRVKPLGETEADLMALPKKVGAGLLKMAAGVDLSTYKIRSAALFSAKLWSPVRRFYRFLAIATRGQSGKNRVYAFVLGEYLLSLVLLAASAVLFWAVAMKAAIAPSNLPLTDFLKLSESNFFPGLPRDPHGIALPYWAVLGPTATAGLLFILYVGAAASLFSQRQEAYARHISTVHQTFRGCALTFARHIRVLEQLAKKLPTVLPTTPPTSPAPPTEPTSA